MAHRTLLTAQTLLRHTARTAVAITVVGTVIAMPTAVAVAAPQKPIPPRPHNWGYSYGAEQPGRNEKSATDQPVSSRHRKNEPGNGVCGTWRLGVRSCRPIAIPTATGVVAGPAPASPAQLAAQAWGRLPVPAPEVRTAPPRGSDGLVGLPEWFWVTNWTNHQDRVQAGGVWAEVTARPTSMTIAPGSGQPPVTCNGPGTAYEADRGAATQLSDCSITYLRSSAGLPNASYVVTVTMTYGGTWRGSGGAGGALPALSRSASFPVRIAEGQALTGGTR